LGLETLERRELMAGNVTVSLSGSDLKIAGDSSSNGVVVSRIDNATIEVRGQTRAGAATSINGVANGSVRLASPTNVYVDMWGGNDEIRFHGHSAVSPLNVPGKMVIYSQSGNDSVALYNVKVGGDLSVNSGTGKDEFYGVGIDVGDDLFVKESANTNYSGNSDFVNIYGKSRIGDQLNVKFNGASDTLKVSDTTAKSFWIETGAGNDSVLFDEVHALNDARIRPGSGSDTTKVGNSRFGDDLIIEELAAARAGERNTIDISGNTVGDYIWVRGNAGEDSVRIRRSVCYRLHAELNGGNDWLNIQKTTVKHTRYLSGGSGNDFLNRADNSAFFASTGFERFDTSSVL
jgi:hypothetical protein